MLVIKTSSELRKSIDDIKNSNDTNNTIAFVPTMGNLHAGHINLVSLAHQYGSVSIVSIFVNPLQFNQVEDLTNYPRTIEHDIDICKKNGVDILFIPSVDDIYPNGDEGERIELYELSSLSTMLEGASRPGHFSGVITVVKKLFDIIRPDFAIFGEKDFQQLLLIKKMVDVLNIPVKIISSKTIREEDGLAMSSRNSKLLPEERELSIKLFVVLKSIREKIIYGDEALIELTKAGCSTLSQLGFRIDYLVVRNSEDLLELTTDNKSDCIILIAAWLGKTRLIDNLRV